MEALLRQVCGLYAYISHPLHLSSSPLQFRPDANIASELENVQIPGPSTITEQPSSSAQPQHSASPVGAVPLQFPSPDSVEDASSSAHQDPESDDDEYGYSMLLTDKMRDLSMGEHTHPFFMGKTSGVKLVRATLNMKMTSGGAMMTIRRPEFWGPLPVRKIPFGSHFLELTIGVRSGRGRPFRHGNDDIHTHNHSNSLPPTFSSDLLIRTSSKSTLTRPSSIDQHSFSPSTTSFTYVTADSVKSCCWC